MVPLSVERKLLIGFQASDLARFSVSKIKLDVHAKLSMPKAYVPMCQGGGVFQPLDLKYIKKRNTIQWPENFSTQKYRNFRDRIDWTSGVARNIH